MVQSIERTIVFTRLIAEAYKLESKTALMDPMVNTVGFEGTNQVKVLKLTTVGLGNYSRTTGYPSGDITAEWVAMSLAAERGRSFSLDRMDNEESLGLVLGNLIRTWMREHVAPEVDAYRLAKYATGAGNIVDTPTTLASGTIKAAIAAGKKALNDDEVPEEGRILYLSSECYDYLEESVTRTLANEGSVDHRVKVYDGMRVEMMPQARFYTQITLNAGASSDAGGFVKTTSTGKDINFMIVHPTAVLQPVKLNQVKYFDPDINQISDGHLWQYRLYHDAFVMENHENGIYLHKKA